MAPTPGISSSGLVVIAFERFARCVPIANRWAFYLFVPSCDDLGIDQDKIDACNKQLKDLEEVDGISGSVARTVYDHFHSDG